MLSLDSFTGPGIVSTVADQSSSVGTTRSWMRTGRLKFGQASQHRCGQNCRYWIFPRRTIEHVLKPGAFPEVAWLAGRAGSCPYKRLCKLRLVSSRRRPGDETDAFPARFGRRSGIAKAGRDVRFVEYPDAQHAYDAPAFKTPLKVAVGQKWGELPGGRRKRCADKQRHRTAVCF